MKEQKVDEPNVKTLIVTEQQLLLNGLNNVMGQLEEIKKAIDELKSLAKD